MKEAIDIRSESTTRHPIEMVKPFHDGIVVASAPAESFGNSVHR